MTPLLPFLFLIAANPINNDDKDDSMSNNSTHEMPRKPARGCPSVWLPLLPKQRAKFLKDMRGWVRGWGDAIEDWEWLEALLDKPKWTKQDVQTLREYSGRGMGYAMDQLVGTKRGTEWHRVRRTCHTEAPVMSMQQAQDSVLKTAAAGLVEQMEAMRQGKWLEDTALQREADFLFEISREALKNPQSTQGLGS